MVREFRAVNDATPIILMGYLNPALSYGSERFGSDGIAAKADGLIMVDLPTEEADMLVRRRRRRWHRRYIIRLVAPTTDHKRLPLVLMAVPLLACYVSITHHRNAEHDGGRASGR